MGVQKFDKLVFFPHVAVGFFFWSDYVDFKFQWKLFVSLTVYETVFCSWFTLMTIA